VHRLSIAVLLVALFVTGALSWLTYELNDHNETRLLKLQTKTARSILEVVIPVIQTPLASAAAIAATTGGDAQRFTSYVSTYVGDKGPFVSVSLWRRDGPNVEMITHAGVVPLLSESPGRAQTFIGSAPKSPTFSVTPPIEQAGNFRLGYAYQGTEQPSSYIVYAESVLPPQRRAATDTTSPLSDLRFAIYLGKSTKTEDLVETNTDHLPLHGRTWTEVIPFGDNSITLVASPERQLGGTLSGSLWWILAIGGGAIAIAAAVVAERLVRRREAAERLTGEVEVLLGEQRTIAETLQHALLPQQLPAIPGVEASVRYIPGELNVDIGGDWYDLVPLADNRFFFAVGDVSGRGVAAGSVMASLRFAMRGFVSEGHSPTQVLEALARLLDIEADQHFATVLCGVGDVARREITLANAGHPPLLLARPGSSEFVNAPVGPPIGVQSGVPYDSMTVTVPAGGLLLAYTDGLIERRGESLDAGLARLQAAAQAASTSLEDLLSAVVSDLTRDRHDDDTAILGVQWLT
jgi:serine phosphatase RsbU (regulator of sigma subunit)